MKKKYISILKTIQDEVPQEWKEHIMKTVKPYGFIKDVMLLAIDDPEFPEEKKNYYRHIIDSGQMDYETEEVDDEITKKIDEFVNNRIKKEVEKKNLPKYAFAHLFKKGRKQIKKLTK